MFTELDAKRRLLLISERRELVGGSDKRVSDYEFVTHRLDCEELSILFARHRFCNIQYFSANDHGPEFSATDCFVPAAQFWSNPGTTMTLKFSLRMRNCYNGHNRRLTVYRSMSVLKR